MTAGAADAAGSPHGGPMRPCMTTAIRTGVCAAFALFAVVALAVSAARIPYPFELEWMEGGSLIQVQRLLAGQGIYVAPTFEFVAHPYGPVYYWLAAVVAAVAGPGFWPLRLLSYLASVGSLAALFAIVRARTGRVDAAVVAACLFAATYRLSGTWFEIARVDALFLFLFLAAAWLLLGRDSAPAAVAAGALLGLSYLTKQTALVMAAPLVLWLFVERWRRGLAVAATAVSLVAGVSLLLDRVSDGWYCYYTVTLGARHPLLETPDLRDLLAFWHRDLLRPLPAACGLALLLGARALARPGRRELLLPLALTLGMLATAWVGRLNSGFDNVLMPAHAGLALLLGLLLGRLLTESAAGGRRGWRAAAAPAVLALLAGQLLMLRFDPRQCLPTDADRAAGEELVNRLREMEGEVVVSAHPYLLALAGKPTHAHQVAITELTGGFGGQADEHGRRLLEQLAADVARQRFAAVILDGPKKPGASEWFVPLAGHYRPAGALFDDPALFVPVTGARRQPRWLMVPTLPGAAPATPAGAGASGAPPRPGSPG